MPLVKHVDSEGPPESMDLGPQGLLEAPTQEITEIHRDAFSKTINFEGLAEYEFRAPGAQDPGRSREVGAGCGNIEETAFAGVGKGFSQISQSGRPLWKY